MRTQWISIAGIVVVLASLGGCGPGHNYFDPYEKPYTWHPLATPESNLAAQLVDPHDLIRGRGGPEGDAKQADLSVERVWQDRPKQVSDVTGTSSGGGTNGGSTGSGSGGGGSGGAGGGPSGGGTN